MKTSRKKVQNRVLDLLLVNYSEENGYELNTEKRWKDYKVDFAIERREGTRRFRTVIKINYHPRFFERDLKHLNLGARKMAGRYVKIVEKILAVPENFEAISTDGSIKIWKIPGLISKEEGLFWKDASTL